MARVKLLIPENLTYKRHVEATLYGTAVNYFTPIIREGRSYIITNAQLHAQQGDRTSSLSAIPFYWVLHTSTPVEPIDGQSTDIHAYNPHFATGAELFASRDTNRHINYLGIVVGHRPRSVGGNTAIIQEYYVIDQRMEPFIVAIWGNNFTDTTFSILNSLERRPLVAFLSFTSTYRHGMSLISTRDSIILFHKNSEAFTSLEDRRSNHMAEIEALINSGNLYNAIRTPPGTNNDTHATTTNVLDSARSPSAPMIVRARPDNDFQTHPYIWCSDCNRSTSVVAGAPFYCGHCTRPRTAIVRFKMCHLLR